MHNSKLFLALLILLLLFSISIGQEQNLIATSHFQIFSQDKSFGEKVGVILEKSYANFVNFFGDSLKTKVQIQVAESEEKFKALVGERIPEWTLAVALPTRNVIVIKSPGWHKSGKSINEVLQHELAHIFLVNYIDEQYLPLWINEGFAVWQSEKWGWDDRILLARVVLTGSLLSLSKIDSLNHFSESKAHLGYAQSFLGVNYINSEYGVENFKKLLLLIKNGENPNSALLKTTGSDYADFEAEYLTYIKKKYNWMTLILGDFPFWTVLAIIFVGLYLYKKRRSKKILQKWEKEDLGIAPKDFDIS
ncbi:MAG: hypothetical protein RBG1_1C00001G1515 [candidate division Zixibacteria bacterium RBG-1]|nr:MAG: hypothetical protein RBG1_1C00001G1515 [candidate division Zixibacteria bacterium RBG-1]OGC83895.1 MAG: hypothetical protein A2V73_08565 [candidate division Zixibacteria bacterium RBG_19FT_COMBO_42_43]